MNFVNIKIEIEIFVKQESFNQTLPYEFDSYGWKKVRIWFFYNKVPYKRFVKS